MGCQRLTYHQKTSSKTESTPIFVMGEKQGSDYQVFGMQMPGRTYQSDEYDYGFNGMYKDDEIKGSGNSLDFGARMYDPRIGRFFSPDPKENSYPWQSTYVFAANNPIRFVDVNGEGPGDRVKNAKSFVGTKYSQAKGLNKGKALRTGTSKEALEYLDCSELVCRVLADDNVTPKIELWTTADLKLKLNDESKFHKSDKPQVGDIFLWRGSDGNHTGIVSGVDENGNIEITHAANSERGTVVDKGLSVSYFTGKDGWEGFYRPVNEDNTKRLLDDASILESRISITKNISEIRIGNNLEKGNEERANKIEEKAKRKIDKLQNKLDSIYEQLESKGVDISSSSDSSSSSTTGSSDESTQERTSRPSF